MTVTIELDNETESVLAQQAAEQGLSLPEYVAKIARDSAVSIGGGYDTELPGQPIPRTPAELVEYLKSQPSGYGDPAIDASTLARQLRRQAETRDWSR